MFEKRIKISGIIYRIECKDEVKLDGCLEPFFTGSSSRLATVDCNLQIENQRPQIYPVRSGASNGVNQKWFEADRTWGLYKRQKAGKNEVLIMTIPSLKGRGIKLFAEFDKDFRNGTVHIDKSCEHYFFYPFLEVLTINLLGHGRGVLFHACCVEDDGRGYLFLGQSGSGKSTMANLWNTETGVRILSDDRVIVNGLRVTAYGTPWHGTANYAMNRSVPVKKIFFISHAQKNNAAKIKGIKSVSELARNAFLPFWDKTAMEYSTEFLIRISQDAELFEMGFSPDKKVIDFVRSI